MRRWLLAIGTLLAGSALSSYADYIVIRVNLGMVRDRTEEEKAAENQPGGSGAMGNRGQAGLGFGGGAPGGFGGGAPGGFGGFRPGAAGGALGGGQRPPGAPGGALGGQPPGPGGFGLGQAKGGGAFTSQQTPTTDEEDEKEVNPLIVTAVIEVEHAHLKKLPNLGQYHITHKWGDTQVYYAPEPELIVRAYGTQTVAQRFYAERRLIKDDAPAPDKIEQFVNLANWALEHGLLDQVDAMMDEVAKLDPKNATLVMFQKMQAEMNREVTQDEPTMEEWRRDRLGDFKAPMNSKHYALLNGLPTANEAQRWLDRLEENYRGFFYWFALRNQALPVPKKRLVAVLLQDQEAFNHGTHDIFDEVPYADDGFFAPRERLAVFAAGRLDQGYLALAKLTKSEFRKDYSVNELFQKKVKLKGHSQNTVARGQTWTLLLKAMEEDSQRAAVTHEGTKQLLSAVGLWPRNVEVPEWLNFGVGSFFETPRGAWWPGVGAPNAVYLDNFLRWDADKKSKFEHNPTEALKAVVKDKYFRDIRAAREKEKDKESFSEPSAPGKGAEIDEEARRERALEFARARTLTWAFTYFLMKQHPNGMIRYIEELKAMPRDMEFDEDTLYSLFARSFGLMDHSEPNKVDENKVAILASDCYGFLRRTPLPWKEDENDGSKRETKPAPGKRGQKPSS